MNASFKVDISSDPVLVRIIGKANYLNCGPLNDFFEGMLKKGTSHFVLDFSECEGMDSTFLGILAGVALKVRGLEPPGSVVLSRIEGRKLELVKNLGLHRILMVQEGKKAPAHEARSTEDLGATGSADQQTMLRAHQSLVEADASNWEKFQDVIDYLRHESS